MCSRSCPVTSLRLGDKAAVARPRTRAINPQADLGFRSASSNRKQRANLVAGS